MMTNDRRSTGTGLHVTGKADVINLDTSDMFVLECPWYDHEGGHLVLGSSYPINQVRTVAYSSNER